MRYISLFFLILLMVQTAWTQSGASTEDYSAYFEEAYEKYPSIPPGLLEATAYQKTRMHHLMPDKAATACSGLPQYYGVMGLVADGKGYFKNTLLKVAEYSGFSVEELKTDPRKNILGYAAAYVASQQNLRVKERSLNTQKPVFNQLSEIPLDNSPQNQYALDQDYYGVLVTMQRGVPGTKARSLSKQAVDLEKIFGKENLKVLESPSVTVSKKRIVNGTGEAYIGYRDIDAPKCTAGKEITDQEGAIWNPAHTSNYGDRRGVKVAYITIHTVQGSYASAISWFRNSAARVSAHYVIRSFDGQITQMVCEDDKAYHVRNDNSLSIGIEHEGFIDDGAQWYTNEMYESSAKLVRDICLRQDIDPLKTFSGPPTNGVKTLGNKCRRIKGHQHFPGNDHIDPGPFWDWARYYRLINPAPDPVRFTQDEGTIFDSGGKDGNYGDQDRITYLIKPEGASSVTLKFKSWEMEGDAEDPYDFLEIYDGTNIYGRLIGRFTGDRSPGTIVAKSGAVYMEFRSDCQVNKAGYHIEYTTQKKNPGCPAPAQLSAGELFPMGVTLSWASASGAKEYILRVKRSLENSWTTLKTTQNSYALTGLGANGLYQWQVTARCGTDSSAVAGSHFITPNISRTNAPQTFTIRGTSGKFYDSGGDLAGYSNEEEYVYRILPSDGGKVEVRFSDFDTENNLDILYVYDGDAPTGDPVGEFSGNKIPPKITSTGSALTFRFVSDKRTTGTGWIATWKTTEGGFVNIPDPPDPTFDPLDPNLSFSSSAPESRALLQSWYSKSFTLSFDDQDKSGAGIANRFYAIAENTGNGWSANPAKGFLYEDFDRGLKDSWKKVEGNWNVVNGRLVQSDVKSGNTNLYTALSQNKNQTYVYHWVAKMYGKSGNIRHGIHFFTNEPEKTNRGTSYFVWARESTSGDKIEIYKVFNDKFLLKSQRDANFDPAKAYDFKVIFNPQRGKIEVYINNNFAASWQDPWPLSTGNAVSLRTGGGTVEFDDIRVYHDRDQSLPVSLGNNPANDIRLQSPDPVSDAFKVLSLTVDRKIQWSKVSETGAKVDFTGSLTGGLVLQDTYKDDFNLTFPALSTTDKGFYLVADLDGNEWQANPKAGFLFDAFSGSALSAGWKSAEGSWGISNGTLEQKSIDAGNSNLYAPLTQEGGESYLYNFRAKLLSSGKNKRFGLHFFSDNAADAGGNRGNSYMVWFRFHDDAADKVEFYRSAGAALPIKHAADVNFESNQWLDIKILCESKTGKLTAWLNDVQAASWTDDQTPLKTGSYVSFRTGNSQVLFDDLRVYRLRPATATITLGTKSTDMVRHESPNASTPALRLYQLDLQKDGKWSKERLHEAKVDF